MRSAWKLISLIYMLLQYNLLPASIGLRRNKGHEQHGRNSCVSDEVYGSERTGCRERGEKTEKLSRNDGGEQCRRAAARFYGRGSCSQPPAPPGTITTRFLFLPAVYCSLHLSHREPHLLKEMRKNNETMGCGA